MKPEENVAEWIGFAKGDMITAEIILSSDRYPRSTEIICNHCQQSAEKALKAFLIANEIEPPKIHDLGQLCEMCEDIEQSFSDVVEHCAELTTYAVTFRYPNEIEVFESDAKRALKYAQVVYEKVESCLLSMEQKHDAEENALPSEVPSQKLNFAQRMLVEAKKDRGR